MACIYQRKRKKAFLKNTENRKKTPVPWKGQVALFTYRIEHLSKHLKINPKDFNTERSLVQMVGKRRNLLDYLKAKDIERYRAIIKKLELRK